MDVDKSDTLPVLKPAPQAQLSTPSRSASRLLNRAANHATLMLKGTWGRCVRPLAKPGTAPWLIGTEIKYGGLVTGVPRGRVSPQDPRSPAQLKVGGMIGGDRMLHHGYAAKYAQYLRPFIASRRRLTLAEFGILKGTGLARTELFPSSRILGFDIDLDHFGNNLAQLKGRGAFAKSTPELHEYDQFVPNSEYLSSILAGDKIDICIDDGFHSHKSILTTLDSVLPSLAEQFVYFIEDNKQVWKAVSDRYPDFVVDSCGQLTVVTPRANG